MKMLDFGKRVICALAGLACALSVASTAHGQRVSVASPSQWQEVGGLLRRISVGSADRIWGVNADGAIFQRTGSSWTNIRGWLTDVSVAADGTVWGVNQRRQVFSWFYYSFKDVDGTIVPGRWEDVDVPATIRPGNPNQVAVRNAEEAWLIDMSGQVFWRRGFNWNRSPVGLTQVSVGNDGTVWGIGRDRPVLYRLEGSGTWNWKEMPGALVDVSVGNKDRVVGINTNGQIVRWTGSGWEVFADFPLTRISVAADGTMWGLDRQGRVFRYVGTPP